MRSVIKPV